MTPIFCCGGECGVSSASAHWSLNLSASFSTSTVRSGTRSIRINPAPAITGYAQSRSLTASRFAVIRFYVYFTVLPDANFALFSDLSNTDGAWFKSSDSKIYAGGPSAGGTFGATGVSVTTGQWYLIDVLIDQNSNPHLIDVKVNGVSCGQYSRALAAADITQFQIGYAGSATADFFIDDIVISNTTADYPIGAGYVNHFIPTSDGTHNVAGANDFERSNTGTDITNATTTAFQLIDDVPLKSGVVSEYINLIAPPNATDYVEVVFGPAPGISTPTTAPRAVDAVVAYASATAGTTNNLRIALNDNGSLDDVLNVTAASPGTTAVYARKHYSDPPSAASAWTLTGNGNFNNVRMRCFTSDAAPDPWWASAMIEAEFQEIVAIPNKIFQVKQAVNRASTY